MGPAFNVAYYLEEVRKETFALHIIQIKSTCHSLAPPSNSWHSTAQEEIEGQLAWPLRILVLDDTKPQDRVSRLHSLEQELAQLWLGRKYS